MPYSAISISRRIMKDSQLIIEQAVTVESISRRIMKDSQRFFGVVTAVGKYIKANNERFSTNG